MLKRVANFSIRRRFALGAFAITLAACLGIGAVAYLQARKSLFEQAATSLEAVAASQARAIDTVVGDYKDRAAAVAAEVRLFRSITPGSSDASLQQLLSSVVAADRLIVQLTLTGPEDRVLASSAPAQSRVVAQGSVSDRLEDSSVALHGIVISDSGDHLLVLSTETDLAQRLYAWIDPTDLYAITQDYSGLGETGETTLASRDANGDALFLTPIRFDPDAAMTRVVEKTQLDVPMTQALLGNQTRMSDGAVDYIGVPVVAATRYLPNLDWGLVAKIQVPELEAPIRRLRNWVVGISVAVLGLAALVSYWFSSGITLSIRSMIETSRRIAAGDTSLRLPVPASNDVGDLARSVNAMLDRLQAASAEVESQSTLKEAILETVDDGIVTVDRDGKIMTYNPACQSIFGYSAAEAIGAPVALLMPRHHAVDHDRYMESYLTTGRKRIIGTSREVEGRRKNGEIFPLDLSIGETRFRDERVFVGMLKEITHRKELERANTRHVEVIQLLQRTTAAANEASSLEQAVEVVLQQFCAHLRWPVGHFWMTDPEDKIPVEHDRLWYLADPLAFAAFREASDELRPEIIDMDADPEGDSRDPVWIADLSMDVHSPRREAAVSSGLRSGLAAPILIGTQTVAILEFYTTDELPADKEVLRIVGQVAQQLGRVYERVRNTVALKRREFELSRTNNHLEDFAYVASHDLRAPLRGIDNLAQWIAEDLEEAMTEESRHNFERLFGRVRRLERLIDDLLAFSRAGRIKQKPEMFDSATVVSAYAATIDLPAEAMVCIVGELPVFNSYRVPFETVIRNLIDNAIKHHDRAEMRIEVACEEEGGDFIFSVADDGPGIAPEYQERIFGLFQTLQPRDDKEASGMGLAVVRRMVETVGGRVWVESNPEERWTRFSFSWPRAHKNGHSMGASDEENQAA